MPNLNTLSMACEQTDDGIILIDTQSILYANPAARNALGFTIDRLANRQPAAIFGEEAIKVLEHAQKVSRETDGKVIIRLLLPDRDGRKLNAECHVTADRESGQTLLVLKSMADNIIHSNRMKSLGDMASGMAHEFNQPLSGIRGIAEGIVLCKKRGWEIREDEILFKLEKIISLVDRMSEMIDHVRKFGAEADILEQREVDLSTIINSALSLTSAQLRARGIEIELNINTKESIVIANPFSVEEIIIILIRNAHDAIMSNVKTYPDAPRKISLILESETRNGSGRTLELRVADTGCGIDEELQTKVFDPFFTTKDPALVTGTGLTVARRLAIAFEGDLELCRNTSPCGTTAILTLPAAAPKLAEDGRQ